MTKTFKQFLEEINVKELTFSELLHGPCANFFKQSKQNGLLVRGMGQHGKHVGHMSLGPGFEGIKFSVFRKSVRKERKPMDTTGPLHNIIDDWFEDNMGIKARSEAIFCFGEAGRENAYEYGSVSVILPIGKFTYVWSPKVGDLYLDIISEKIQQNGKITSAYIGSDGKPDVEAIHAVLDGLGYTINGFDKAVGDAVEIMIDCDDYYVIPLPNDIENRDKHLGILKKAFVEA